VAALFPGFDADVGDRVPDPAGADEPDDTAPDDIAPDDTAPDDTGDDRPPLDEGATVAELLAEAEALFADAEAELRSNGDLGAYQERLEDVRELIIRALEISEEG
jgi:hypothetical protein